MLYSAVAAKPENVNTFNLRMPADLKLKGQRVAKARGTDLAALVRGFVIELVEAHEAKHGTLPSGE